MSLTDTIRKDMFMYTKDRNGNAADILKMALASIKNAEIEKEEPLTEEEIIKILRKEVKKIEDSIVQFEHMGRQDLLDKEKSQLEIIKAY
ncbi:MAG: GatB/YqeY domain-containing protein, partial [Candidatus Dojkabacteria bacterium]|nr:GatB/YqeY domain-containing protein [Candidatus Dojkabacteria bacterium]